MDAVLDALAAWPLATFLRQSWWAYPLVNVGHVLGLAALFGAILVLDLRMLGAFRSVAVDAIGGPAVRVAAAGLLVAAATGVLLFVVRPVAYAENPVFLAKIGFVGLGVVNAVIGRFAGLDRRAPALVALVSLGAWTGAIAAGRLIAYFEV